MFKIGAIANPQSFDRKVHARLYETVRDITRVVNALVDLSGATSTPSAAVIAGQVVPTIPGPSGRLEHDETLAAVGVTPGMKVLLSLAPHSDADENNEQALDLIGMAGEAGAGAITVRLAFGSLTSGPIRINYMAV